MKHDTLLLVIYKCSADYVKRWGGKYGTKFKIIKMTSINSILKQTCLLSTWK
jgi:hypothetical protein